jgi:hypothetical protein
LLLFQPSQTTVSTGLEASVVQGLKHQESFSFVQFQCNASTFNVSNVQEKCPMFKKTVS